MRTHEGAHPRVGALDVVPWITLTGRPLRDGRLSESVRSRNEFAAWAATELELPCFLYGPERSLPDVRREAWVTLRPDLGPPAPHRTAGAAAIGARSALVAYNVWLAEGDLALARSLASAGSGTVGQGARAPARKTGPGFVQPHRSLAGRPRSCLRFRRQSSRRPEGRAGRPDPGGRPAPRAPPPPP